MQLNFPAMVCILLNLERIVKHEKRRAENFCSGSAVRGSGRNRLVDLSTISGSFEKDAYEIAYVHTPALTRSVKPRPVRSKDFKLNIIFLSDATKDMQAYGGFSEKMYLRVDHN